MTTIRIEQVHVGSTSDVDRGGEEGAGPADAAAPQRPGCIFTAALRHRAERTGAVAAVPPHLSTFGSEACEHLWTEWAEKVRAAVVAEVDR